MRKFLLSVALLFGITFLFTHLADMEAIIKTLKRGDWRYLMLAVGVQVFWLVNIAASYRAIYRIFGVEMPIEHLLVQVVAANFINVTTPSGGMGGMTVFVLEAKKRGVSAIRATLVGVLFTMFEYTGFSCVMIVGILVLIRRRSLLPVEGVASVILFVISIAMILVVVLGMRSAHMLGTLLARVAYMINRALRPLIRKDYLSETRAHEFAREAEEGFRELLLSSGNLLWPAALALSNKALLLTIFFLSFLAFSVPFSPGTLIAGFSVGYLFTLISPTPAGIGIVEGTLTIALGTLHVPLSSATLIVLTFRGITLWLPMLYGFFAIRQLRKPEAEAS